MKLNEITKRINKYLERLEADPAINAIKSSGHHPYYNANAHCSGSRIFVAYVNYNGYFSLTKEIAIKYLEWLDAGNAGTHYDALRCG